METLVYRCPHCDDVVKVDEALTGDTITCPNPDCDRPFKADIPSAMPAARNEFSSTELEEADNLREVHAGNSEEESIISVTHPAMFRMHPLWFIGHLILLGAGLLGVFRSEIFDRGLNIIGPNPLFWLSLLAIVYTLIFMISWWVRIIQTKLTITSKRSILEKGLISRKSTEVQHDDVRNLQVSQNAIQRLLGVGDLAVSSSGQDDLEIEVKAIPQPNQIADTIRDMQ